jgi:hypothetical protein
VSTSTNHSEIIALYEASRECVWLRRMINHIIQSCRIGALETPTIIFEDNSACVTRMESCYIKSNMNKHIIPKLFYPHELQKNGEIKILQIKSCDNLADLFTKSLPYFAFHKCVEGIGMRRLRDLQESIEPTPNTHYTLFPLYEFYFSGVFSHKIFNEVMLTHGKYHIIYFSSKSFFKDNIMTY